MTASLTPIRASPRSCSTRRTSVGWPSSTASFFSAWTTANPTRLRRPANLTPEERAWLADAAAWGATEGAYAAMHRTKPQTAAFALTDSPVGLAAWLVEMLPGVERLRRRCGAELTKDEILTNITIYWLTETIGSSMRMCRANAAIPPAQHARRVEVPFGFSIFAGDVGHFAPSRCPSCTRGNGAPSSARTERPDRPAALQ